MFLFYVFLFYVLSFCYLPNSIIFNFERSDYFQYSHVKSAFISFNNLLLNFLKITSQFCFPKKSRERINPFIYGVLYITVNLGIFFISFL